jgi:hypothetical protein
VKGEINDRQEGGERGNPQRSHQALSPSGPSGGRERRGCEGGNQPQNHHALYVFSTLRKTLETPSHRDWRGPSHD